MAAAAAAPALTVAPVAPVSIPKIDIVTEDGLVIAQQGRERETRRDMIYLTLFLFFSATIIDHEQFKSIPMAEFLHKNFMNPQTSPKFTAMVERFNRVRKRDREEHQRHRDIQTQIYYGETEKIYKRDNGTRRKPLAMALTLSLCVSIVEQLGTD